ncbi:hypothetical protein [Janthinobacterium sp. PAMC25594]|uniref:hypothetical protein n=1 Tax=Janthinobacterium sp. PAMC25594 TaxID=2861284 RepID=UPI001C63A6F8|nr:hypothetical protein [Janthinobacterium sp. PAMC25594]QYG08938.1 hypothetical protein KY494_09430 [Janthinobacterium sp. PAMC25594]
MNMEKHRTVCGGFIGIPTRVLHHLQAHPDVIVHLSNAISKIHLPSDRKKIECEVEMGCIVGRGGVVKTNALKIDDLALFALRTNRKFPSRVAPSGQVGTESSTIVIIAKPSFAEGQYELITAWIGSLAKKEPWDPSILSQDEFEDCLHFWSTTALVFDPATMGTVSENSWRKVLALANPKFG